MEEALLLIKSLPYGPSEYRTPRGFRNLKSIGGSEGKYKRKRNRHRHSELPVHQDEELLYQNLVQLSGDVEKISENALGWQGS